MRPLNFQSISGTAPAAAIGAAEALIGHGVNGFFRLPREIARGELTDNLPVVWDLTASLGVVPATLGTYGHRYQRSAGNRNLLRDGTINATDFSLTYAGEIGQASTLAGIARFNGLLSGAGKFWMTLNWDTTDFTTSEIKLHVAKTLGAIGRGDTANVMTIVFSKATISAVLGFAITSDTDINVSATENKRVLICFDLDNNEIILHAASNTLIVAFDVNAPLTGCALAVTCHLTPVDNDTPLTADFSTTAANSPVAIPAGFTPLTLIDGTVPANAFDGCYLSPSTNGNLNGDLLYADDVYLYVNGETYPIYSQKKLVESLLGDNSFLAALAAKISPLLGF